jgi:hypothetical protein
VNGAARGAGADRFRWSAIASGITFTPPSGDHARTVPDMTVIRTATIPGMVVLGFRPFDAEHDQRSQSLGVTRDPEPRGPVSAP